MAVVFVCDFWVKRGREWVGVGGIGELEESKRINGVCETWVAAIIKVKLVFGGDILIKMGFKITSGSGFEELQRVSDWNRLNNET